MRRVHVSELKPGLIELDEVQSHHLRDVLRIQISDQIELFDNTGTTAVGRVNQLTPVLVQVDEIADRAPSLFLTIAAAIPKGDRADWMVEKLSELGVAEFIPLIAERSVVIPAGKNKLQRWERIAVESAKQSPRPGVMRIAPVTELANLLSRTGCFLSTNQNASPLADQKINQNMLLAIGPEGGWTEEEEIIMTQAGWFPARLTETILRVETAAILAAGHSILIAAGNSQKISAPLK